MALIQWNPSFSVNVKDIDAQHQQLVEIINQLHEAMSQGKGSQEISAAVEKMVEYSRRHFQYEEKLLAQYQYPGSPFQQAEHKAFIQKVAQFQQNAASGQIGLSVVVSNFLKDWWTKHIQVEDMKYSQYLNAKGVR